MEGKNLFKKILEGAKIVAVGAALTTSIPKANAQQTEQQLKDSLNKKEISIETQFNIEDIYNKNKEENDALFNVTSVLENTPDKVLFKCEDVHKNRIEITVKHKNEEGEVSKEFFTSLQELGTKYKNYSDQIDVLISEAYKEHVHRIAWDKIITEQETKLLNNFTNYKPTLEEIELLKSSAERKNAGGTTDGYDEIYHYYVDKFKSKEDIYEFNRQHNGTAENLAMYMINIYYKPLLND